MQSRLDSLLLALLALPFGVSAISLSSWLPAAKGLTSSCETVYKATIPGCVASDFGKGNHCSSSCISGLVSIMDGVYEHCTGSSQNDQSIIGVFLSGKGIQDLCPGVDVQTAGPATSSPPHTSAPPVVHSTTAPSSSASSSAIVVDSSSSPVRTSSKSSSSQQPTSTSSTHSTGSTVTLKSTVHSTVRQTSTHIIVSTRQPSGSTSASSQTSAATAAATNCSGDSSSPFGGSSCSGASHLALSLWTAMASMTMATCLLLFF